MPTVSSAELASHWGVGRSYLSALRKARSMPEFASLEAADTWRNLHAPPKRREKTTTTTNPKESGEGGAEPAQGGARAAETESAARVRPPAEVIDVRQFLRAGEDFDGLMIQQALEVAQVAHGLYLQACQSGEPTRVALALKNWTDAAERAAAARTRFLDLQERSKTVVSIDTVLNIVGQQLEGLRALLLRFGSRVAADANPADPSLAQRIVDAEVDRVFARIASADAVVREETVAAAAQYAEAG